MSGAYTLELEVVGANVHHLVSVMDRRMGAALRSPMADRMLRVYCRPRPPDAWVEEVRPDGARVRLRGNRTYERAKGSGYRGVYDVYHLWPGRTYEVSEPVSGRRARRYFCRVTDGGLEEIDEPDVR